MYPVPHEDIAWWHCRHGDSTSLPALRRKRKPEKHLHSETLGEHCETYSYITDGHTVPIDQYTIIS